MSQKIPIHIHEGNALVRLANQYPDLHRVLKEIIQNAIDSGATTILAAVNLLRRNFAVCDNGSGASEEKFHTALQSVADSMKESGKYGQFGLGLISPISILEKKRNGQFSFTTCASPHKSGYTEYVFNLREMEGQSSVSIPKNAVPSLRFTDLSFENCLIDDNPFNNGETVWWRTAVLAEGITTDKRISSFNASEFANQIGWSFNEAIRQRNIKIRIHFVSTDGKTESLFVDAPEFQGKPINVFDCSNPDSGNVRMELYTALISKGVRRGEILFGNSKNPSRINCRQFVNCAGDILGSEISKVLLSGIFEGKILCDKISLHQDRTRFEINDALTGLCIEIENWYKKIGKKLYQEILEENKGLRLQEIGVEVMPYLDMLLKQVRYQPIYQRVKIGTIGPGHTDISKSKILGIDPGGKSISTSGNPFVPPAPPKDKDNKPKKKPEIEHPNHIPGTVYGPHGKRRREVRNNSTGMRIVFDEEMEDFRIPFHFDPNTGTLSINIRHPSFSACQERDEWLVKWQMAIIDVAFATELARGPDGTIHHSVLDIAYETLINNAFQIVNGEAITSVGKKKRK